MYIVIDHDEKKYWIFDASMQLNEQWRRFGGMLKELSLAGVFLTHAHVGHYLGLPYLGKECSNTRHMPLYASAAMHSFLESNQPFGVLYSNNNIEPIVVVEEDKIQLTQQLSVTPHAVKHRADFTDTFAFTIFGPTKTLFFCPDIDSWTGLQPLYSLPLLLTKRDYLLLDATFYDNDEVPAGRDMKTIPHPRVVDTISIVASARSEIQLAETINYESSNIHWGEVVLIHLNHSNRLWHRGHASIVETVEEMKLLNVFVGLTGQSWRL